MLVDHVSVGFCVCCLAKAACGTSRTSTYELPSTLTDDLRSCSVACSSVWQDDRKAKLAGCSIGISNRVDGKWVNGQAQHIIFPTPRLLINHLQRSWHAHYMSLTALRTSHPPFCSPPCPHANMRAAALFMFESAIVPDEMLGADRVVVARFDRSFRTCSIGSLQAALAISSSSSSTVDVTNGHGFGFNSATVGLRVGIVHKPRSTSEYASASESAVSMRKYRGPRYCCFKAGEPPPTWAIEPSSAILYCA